MCYIVSVIVAINKQILNLVPLNAKAKRCIILSSKFHSLHLMKEQKIVIFAIRMLKEGFIVEHKHSNSCFKSKILSSIHSEYYRIKCLHNVANCLILLYAQMQLYKFISKTIVLFESSITRYCVYLK